MELLMTGFGDLSSSKALLLGSSSGIKDCPDMHFCFHPSHNKQKNPNRVKATKLTLGPARAW
jgi:hypothetical protein